MNRTERFYRIDQMLHERRVVPIETFLDELAISRATFKRDVEYLRERLHAPIVWDREAGGYRFDHQDGDAAAHALPGLWFSAGELYALLAAHQLLGALEPGVLALARGAAARAPGRAAGRLGPPGGRDRAARAPAGHGPARGAGALFHRRRHRPAGAPAHRDRRLEPRAR
ncbi:MAG: HTH domain-containing protein [Ottowia sp.]